MTKPRFKLHGLAVTDEGVDRFLFWLEQTLTEDAKQYTPALWVDAGNALIAEAAEAREVPAYTYTLPGHLTRDGVDATYCWPLRDIRVQYAEIREVRPCAASRSIH